MRLLEYLTDRFTGKAPKGSKRHKDWRKVRAAHLSEFPTCAVCGRKKKLQVHHKIAFHIAPELELVKDNLITLCTAKKKGINCHLLIGHLGNFRRINISVEADARYWNVKIR